MNGFENYDGYNCGGYALNIPVCIYGDGISRIRDNALDQCVWGLLRKFDFIRLIEEDDQVQEDEYKVHYRVGTGHHFVKDDNGVLTDKWENKAPGIFKGWGKDLEDKPEAVFAVKRNHNQNYRYSIFIADLVSENFERKVKREICCNNKNFIFDNREYEIIKPYKDDLSFYEVYNRDKERIASAIYIPKRDMFKMPLMNSRRRYQKKNKKALYVEEGSGTAPSFIFSFIFLFCILFLSIILSL